nr:hypothetical protein [Actinomycetales bacterium]
TVTGEVPLTVTGGSVPVVGAAGLVLLAAAASLLLASRVLARVVGGLAAVLAVAAAVVAATAVADPTSLIWEAAVAATGLGWSGDAITRHAPAWIGIMALVLGAAAGTAVAALGGREDAPSRFERTRADGDVRTRAMDDWDAIGRGEDPSENGGRLGSQGGDHD